MSENNTTLTKEEQEHADQMAELIRLRAENAKLKAMQSSVTTKRLTLKVSEKGALSVYGMGRFPVTLYKAQWIRLLDIQEEIRQFIVDNAAALVEDSEEKKAERKEAAKAAKSNVVAISPKAALVEKIAS